MISSFGQSKLNSIAFIISTFISGLMASWVISNPYAREFIPIPDIGGIFVRSLMIVMFLYTIWIFQYGWVKATWLIFAYYVIHEFIFASIWLGAYGINIFDTLALRNIFWDLRIIPFPFIIYIGYHYRIFKINTSSILTGLMFFAWFALLLYWWPFSWFAGEGNIPLSPIPQIQETMYNILFPLWFYFLVKLK